MCIRDSFEAGNLRNFLVFAALLPRQSFHILSAANRLKAPIAAHLVDNSSFAVCKRSRADGIWDRLIVRTCLLYTSAYAAMQEGTAGEDPHAAVEHHTETDSSAACRDGRDGAGDTASARTAAEADNFAAPVSYTHLVYS